jgi:transposase-like protein
MERRTTFPLVALDAVQELRIYLDGVEAESILRAKELGASAEDIAQALGITRQGAYYKLKQLERTEAADPEGGVEDVTVTLPEAEAPHREPA